MLGKALAPGSKTGPGRYRDLDDAGFELSGDEDDGPKAIPNPAHPRKTKRGLFANLNLDWLQALVFIVLGPLILVSLHVLCKNNVCKPALPSLPKNLTGYWSQQAFVSALGFGVLVRFLSLVPLGTRVRSVSGNQVRLNG